ncbi:general secretion pathway protein [Bordetella genomosp. 9]|uniref:General secretion pathway protein n=1 Tax=Bordetella genomosp. 9 TaxID=1416803 RepID=A0A261RFV7_9BORD|nr:ATPase, T2SS/T4P/T4SS family [Bordetella genomosp. 9]OZI23510.1 general secretion pathway protein [Bordetella genomosp. 9]
MHAARAAVPVLATQDDIARIDPAFARAVGDEFDLASLAGRLCPVRLQDGSIAIFALSDYAAGDQIDEIERMVRRRGGRLASPSRYILPAPLLLSVARGQLTLRRLRDPAAASTASIDRNTSALAAGFCDIVTWGVRRDASDVHLNVRRRSPESDVRFTIAGRYVAPARFRHMPTATLMEMLAVAWMDIHGGNGAVFDPCIEQQGQLHIHVDDRPVMLRWASLATDEGPSVCLRLLRLDMRADGSSLHTLGYLDSQIDMLRQAGRADGGAVVLAGVVGSGKSTTIATLIRTLPDDRKVVTLEDPVEYRIGNALQNSVARKLDDTGATAFDAKLRTVKRSAMDDLLIGEIRDAETGRAFMDLAGSGVNLYTTTHAASALMIPERLASDFIGVSRDFLATPGVLKLLVYQALLPRLCPHCALPLARLHGGPQGDAWWQWTRRFTALYGVAADVLRMRNAAGCEHCANAELPHLNGTAGRTVVAEMIEPAHDDVFLRCVRRRDNLALRRHLRARRGAPFDHPDMTGKSAMECAVYKAAAGQIDPRDIESRFQSYASVQRERAQAGDAHA